MKYLGQLNEASNATVRSLLALSQLALPCAVIAKVNFTIMVLLFRTVLKLEVISFNHPLIGVGVLVQIDFNLTWYPQVVICF